MDIIFPKSSVMNDFIEKSLFRFGNYIFNDVELLVEKKPKLVNIDIELPIAQAVYRILRHPETIEKEIRELLSRAVNIE